MAAIVASGLRAGALGWPTSRTKFHRTSTGEHVPSHFADLEELRVICRSLKDHGDGVIGLLCDFDEPEDDIAGSAVSRSRADARFTTCWSSSTSIRIAGSRC